MREAQERLKKCTYMKQNFYLPHNAKFKAPMICDEITVVLFFLKNMALSDGDFVLSPLKKMAW